MAECYTSGVWHANPGEEQDLVAAWSEFAEWASAARGAGTLRLLRDLEDPSRFISFGDWESAEAIRAWKGSSEFVERIGRVKAHAELQPDEWELVATVGETR